MNRSRESRFETLFDSHKTGSRSPERWSGEVDELSGIEPSALKLAIHDGGFEETKVDEIPHAECCPGDTNGFAVRVGSPRILCEAWRFCVHTASRMFTALHCINQSMYRGVDRGCSGYPI